MGRIWGIVVRRFGALLKILNDLAKKGLWTTRMVGTVNDCVVNGLQI